MPPGDARQPSVLGADGCKGGGWVVAQVSASGFVGWHYADDTAALLALRQSLGAARLAVDVPIGLPAAGVRAADVQARQALRASGPSDASASTAGGGAPARSAASSVFAAPHRSVLSHTRYADARPDHPTLSAQSFALVSRIKDVDDALGAAGSSVHEVVAECHPEVAFRTLTGAALPSKKTAPGALLRLRALEAALGPLPPSVDARAVLDDALDAAACAWVALRWLRGEARFFGDGEVDELGVPMRILV